MRRARARILWAAALVGGAAITSAASACAEATPSQAVAPLPLHLRDTGLYADWATKTVAPANRPFTPQYPLWSDGAQKRRWIYLPPGSAIDATAPDAWQFPVGTRMWKEFAFARRAETRFMERTDQGWRYATYVWSEDGREATLAPSQGAHTSVPIGGGLTHVIPSEPDCRVCHGMGPTPVLGFSALQLSSDRDPNAPHREPTAPDALDLEALVAAGRLHGWPASRPAPRIAARTTLERAALGYLHGNCGGCHQAQGAAGSLDMVLLHPSAGAGEPGLLTTVGRPSHYRGAGGGQVRVAPGDPDHSVLLERMRARTRVAQMPPLGTQLVDEEAVELITRWIDQLGVTTPRPEAMTQGVDDEVLW